MFFAPVVRSPRQRPFFRSFDRSFERFVNTLLQQHAAPSASSG